MQGDGETSEGSVSDADLESARVTRRAAMRAAAAGAVAAGAFIAPRVEGLSIVPEYAAAASGNDSSDEDVLATATQRANSAALCLLRCCVTCWNSVGISTTCARTSCTCGTNKSCGNAGTDGVAGTLTVNKNAPLGTIDLEYNLWGPTEGCSNQSPVLNLALSGVDPPHQSCDVSVVVACDQGTPVGGGTATGVTTNGTVPGITAPSCTGSLEVDGGPATAYCPAPATVTITLACTFN